MNISEKVAYLKGLMSGLSFDETTKEAKMFSAIIDALDDISMSLTDLEENQGELEELVSIMDEDLGELEDDFYGYDEEDDEYDDDDEL